MVRKVQSLILPPAGYIWEPVEIIGDLNIRKGETRMNHLLFYFLMYLLFCMGAFIAYRRNHCSLTLVYLPAKRIYHIYWSVVTGVSLAFLTREIISGHASGEQLIPGFFLLLLCFFAAYTLHGRYRITSAGLLIFFNLLEWEIIKDWHWDQKQPNLLIVNYNMPDANKAGSGQLQLTVPANRLRQINDILEHYCPQAPPPEPEKTYLPPAKRTRKARTKNQATP